MHHAIYVYVCISCLHLIAMAFVFASRLQCNCITSTWRLFLHCTCTAVLFASHIFLLSSFFLHHFIYLCFNMFLKSIFSCSLTLLFDLCKFLYSFVLVLHVSNFLGIFLFDVLCKCNFSGFYITFIIFVSFFFLPFICCLFYSIYNVYYYEKGLLWGFYRSCS
jgi:hypothetical protein